MTGNGLIMIKKNNEIFGKGNVMAANDLSVMTNATKIIRKKVKLFIDDDRIG